MSSAPPPDAKDERIATLEDGLDEVTRSVGQELSGFEVRLRRMEAGPWQYSEDQARRPVQMRAPVPSEDPVAAAGAQPVSRLLTGMSFGDLVGGRVLAWLGGTATLLGIVLFLALAISRGWIDEEARVLLAGAASAALMAAGDWLHRHRGRTEAAVVMVGTATAGLFATSIVTSAVYGLLPWVAAEAAVLLVAAVATTLAIRWAGGVVGALSLTGALLAGVALGAPTDLGAIAMLALAAVGAIAVAVWRRWRWLAPGTVLICAPQWAIWVLQGQTMALSVLVLTGFSALGLLAGVALQLRSPAARLQPASATAIALSACMAAVIGRLALAEGAGAAVGDLWLCALAGVHIAVGVWRNRRSPLAWGLRELLLGIGVVLLDVAFGLSADGITLAIGWSASAVTIAWLGRRYADEDHGEIIVGLGVGAQIALALIRVLIDAPPSALAGGHPQLAGLLSVSVLAAGCLASGHLSSTRRPRWRTSLNALGLVAIAYLTASALAGAPLAAAWAFEGLALARLSLRGEERLPRRGALAFIGGAVIQALLGEAPPSGLITGVGDLGSATLALGALAVVGLRVGLTTTRGTAQRLWSLLGAAGALLYLASIALISAFQPTSAALGSLVLDLSVRQQGQVALSMLWSLVGLAALIVGLRKNIAPVRTAALALLLITVGKVFLYDLSTLTSLYRVVSFIVLGLLLLAGAFAYQRLRPPRSAEPPIAHSPSCSPSTPTSPAPASSASSRTMRSRSREAIAPGETGCAPRESSHETAAERTQAAVPAHRAVT